MITNENLEIRGINRSELVAYLKELGGKQVSDEENVVMIKSGDWSCQVEPEEIFTFMHSDLPKVHLEFYSENKETLAEVLRKFRLKTFRAGG